jgi:hypothetical protein
MTLRPCSNIGFALGRSRMMSSKRTAFAIILSVALVAACAGTKEIGGGLWDMFGGQSGVSSLVNEFAAKLKKNAAVEPALGAAGIESTRTGLYNSIAATAGYKIPEGTDLMGSLKGKKLDPAVVNGIGASLNAAAKDRGLRGSQVEALNELWRPVEKDLLANK